MTKICVICGENATFEYDFTEYFTAPFCCDECLTVFPKYVTVDQSEQSIDKMKNEKQMTDNILKLERGGGGGGGGGGAGGGRGFGGGGGGFGGGGRGYGGGGGGGGGG